MLKLTPSPDPNAPKPQSVNLPGEGSGPALQMKKTVMSQGFLANLKDFFTEKPVKVGKVQAGSTFVPHDFGSGFMDNLKDWFRGGGGRTKGAMASLRGASAPGIKIEYKPFYKTFFLNIKDLILPPKEAPLNVTSKPVKVKDIWSKDEVFSRAQIISFVVHGSLIAVILFFALRTITAEVKKKTNNVLITPVDISQYQAKLPPGKMPAAGGGGGGDREKIPASKGMAPKFSMQAQLAPPELLRNPNARLLVTPTLVGPDNLKIPSPDMDRWGDPLGKMITDSNGSGSGGGMGTGSGGGIGSGTGAGLGPGIGGGVGGGVFRAGADGIGTPVCIFCPRPEYSEEARKARVAGSVYLDVVVKADGHAGDIKVVKGMGMGLDEKAVDMVKSQWTFKPAMGRDGKPVATIVEVEVIFQLY
jgi:periplasmic protein TonB